MRRSPEARPTPNKKRRRVRTQTTVRSRLERFNRAAPPKTLVDFENFVSKHVVKMSWGAELWDKYEDLCRYSATSIDFLENSVADFIKERGKVEKEYAKNLRALVKKYTPKTVNPDKNSSGPQSLRFEDEFSHLEAYKEVSNQKFQSMTHTGIRIQNFGFKI